MIVLLPALLWEWSRCPRYLPRSDPTPVVRRHASARQSLAWFLPLPLAGSSANLGYPHPVPRARHRVEPTQERSHQYRGDRRTDQPPEAAELCAESKRTPGPVALPMAVIGPLRHSFRLNSTDEDQPPTVMCRNIGKVFMAARLKRSHLYVAVLMVKSSEIVKHVYHIVILFIRIQPTRPLPQSQPSAQHETVRSARPGSTSP